MNLSEMLICGDCIHEECLRSQIFMVGCDGVCSYCCKQNKTKSLEWLSGKIRDCIQGNYSLTNSEPDASEWAVLADKESGYDWEREGQQIKDLILELLGIDSNAIASDIQEYLCDLGPDENDTENPYEEDAYYEEGPVEKRCPQDSWDSFCLEVKYRSRFFNIKLEDMLNQFLGGVHSLLSRNGDSVVEIIKPGSASEFSIFRARTAQSERDIEKILISPTDELGAPPRNYVRSGRMNPAGISVFYGATDRNPCIAESRALVGSYVVIGSFNVLREVRLLNLDKLRDIEYRGSLFDSKSHLHWEQAAFLQVLVKEFTRPVMPDDKELEYLPTQVVAEYLVEKISPKIDGIIFQSSQLPSDHHNNIVLFNHASFVEPHLLPEDSKISIDFGWRENDYNYDDSISVFEKVSNKKILEKPSDGKNETATLRLDVNKIEVHRVDSVLYKTAKRSVSRSRND